MKIRERMECQGGYSLKVVGANTQSFSTVYRVGDWVYVYDTYANTYYIDGRTGKESEEAIEYAWSYEVNKRKAADTLRVQGFTYLEGIVDRMTREHGNKFFRGCNTVERLRYYFREYAKAYLLDVLPDDSEQFIDSLESQMIATSYHINAYSKWSEAEWAELVEDLLANNQPEPENDIGNVYLY